MSSVQDVTKCPNCGGMYVSDFDCRTFESYYFCNRCGRTEEHKIVRDNDGKAVLDEDGLVKYEHSVGGGYGCARFSFDKIAQLFPIVRHLDKEIKNDYLKTIEDPQIKKDECYLTAWNEERNEIIAVFGKLPQSYDEFKNETDGDEAESA